jgi:predicted nucleic acid-binding protein
MTSARRRGLLDTSAIIDYDPLAVVKHVDEAAICVITVAELATGLHTGDPIVDDDRTAFLYGIRHAFGLLPFDEECAMRYGALTAVVRRAGRSPRRRQFDLMIAAVAVRNRLPLLTRNPVDFKGLHESLTVLALGAAPTT